MLYEYRCAACNQVVTQLKRVADMDNPDPCEHCGGSQLHRLVVTPPVVVIDGTDTGFPGASMKWDRDRAATMRREQKNLRETGDYYKSRRHW